MQRKNVIILSIVAIVTLFSLVLFSPLFLKSSSPVSLVSKEFNLTQSPDARIVIEAATMQNQFTTLDSPQKVKIKSSVKGATVTWDSVESSTAYEIFRKEKGEDFKKIAQTEICKFKDGEPQDGCKYKIRAIAGEVPEIIYSTFSLVVKFSVVSGIDPSNPMVALTFDDGPSIYTKDILKVLKKYNAHATFFVVGERVNSTYASAIKKAVKIGCEIGNHSYSHANLGTSSKSVIQSQLNKTDKRVKSFIGSKTALVRPPYGSIGTTLRSVVGKPMMLWSIDTLDWKTRNAKSTIKAIMSDVEDGDIVLMHDLYSQSRDAAVTVIPKLIKKGYQLVTVSELAKYKGVDLEAGTAYSSFKK